MTKSALIKFLEPYPDDIEIWQDDGALILPIEPVTEKVTVYKIEYPNSNIFWELQCTEKDKVIDKKEVLFIGL